ncbi:MAG: SDR family oxidoreductase [Prolixibacteraceae bacterium]|nr:SDR family oxidoreductase [Prolixibacteraceae bacterium]
MTTLYNPFSLIGKTILITGATSGIGRATAIECSKMGARVIITGRKEKSLDDTFKHLKGHSHLKYIADLNQDEEVVELCMNLPEINGLVHSAGIVKTLPFKFINRTDLNTIFNLNFMVPVLLSQKLIKAKKLKKESSIVFLSSIEGPIIAHIGNSMYSASKGAISSIIKSMALELATKRIRVNSILPGMIETPLIESEAITKEQLEEEMQKYPLKRYGKPEEIAHAVIYLLSDASSWITGTNLVIDGGFTLT